MKRKWLIIILFAVCLSAAAILMGKSAASSKTVPAAAPVKPVSINTFLTNDLSGTFEGSASMDKDVRAFMRQWGLHGVSIAVTRNDSLVFAKGYGEADEGVEMGPGHILRMASVSKLITAVGIMVLEERGMISLQDTVFGPTGILNDSLFTASINRDKAKYRITVEQLLRHKAGFTNSRGDPLFSTRDIMRQFSLDSPPDSRTLVSCVLKRPLGYQPGTWQKYSNFGYHLLSLIIEKVSGEDYETFIQKNVLEPACCYDMHIANTYYEERYPNEVRYYMHSDAGPVEEYNMSGRLVERCYGGNDIRGLSGAGAWCGSPAEICRLVAAIDGKPEVPDIISVESIAAMTEYFDKETFSLGWNDTKPNGEWTRTGTLGGTSALVKHYPDGECWVIITNTSTWKGPGFSRYTEALFRNCREKYSAALPARNLFEEPAETASQPASEPAASEPAAAEPTSAEPAS